METMAMKARQAPDFGKMFYIGAPMVLEHHRGERRPGTLGEQADMDDATERWLPVVGYIGLYEVSDLGRIRSLDRLEQITGPRPGTRHRRGRILRQFTMKNSPYLFVRLSKEGLVTSRAVHSLTLEAFTGPRPDGMEGRHLNGHHQENSATNLVWGTKSENTFDQVIHGTHRNSRKTQCPQGHEYDYAVPGTSHRQCKTCRRARSRQGNSFRTS